VHIREPRAPSLVTCTHDSELLLNQRDKIARLIERMDQALGVAMP